VLSSLLGAAGPRPAAHVVTPEPGLLLRPAAPHSGSMLDLLKARMWSLYAKLSVMGGGARRSATMPNPTPTAQSAAAAAAAAADEEEDIDLDDETPRQHACVWREWLRCVC
jgi:hypothetical protein